MDKLLTIAIPTYNRKKYIERAINSIINQCFEIDANQLEILVSDNCSNDGTKEMIERNYPNIIYSCNDKNLGYDLNLLKCYSMAAGKFILSLGSDDIMTFGSLKRIMNFLNDHHDCNAVFLNHGFFSDEYINIDSCYKLWHNIGDDVVTYNKKEIMDYIGRQITYMSCLIINRTSFMKLEHPEKYVGTYFIHSNIMLECCKHGNSLMGIVGYPCVADNLTPGDAVMDNSPEKSFEVFGKGMDYTLCNHAVECGFDRSQMRKIFMQSELFKWPGLIVYLKRSNNTEWKKEFKMYGYPILKKYPVALLVVAPFVIMPRCVAIFIRRYIRPIYKKYGKKNLRCTDTQF